MVRSERSAGTEAFAFGKNWGHFLKRLDEERIAAAETSLTESLERPSLEGASFLDIGSGSGLFSLAARRLGARVHSLDVDRESVACTRELKRRYFPEDPEWTVERASVLDDEHMEALGDFDVVYSWGVLHHTGSMWKALENAAIPVASGGLLWVAIYNDQGLKSRLWRKVKRLYNRLPSPVRPVLVLAAGAWLELRALPRRLARREHPLPWLRRRGRNRKRRGMTFWYDLVDWVGGYPFEVARPEEIFDFYRDRGFTLERLRTVGGSLGNNEFVFRKRQEVGRSTGESPP